MCAYVRVMSVKRLEKRRRAYVNRAMKHLDSLKVDNFRPAKQSAIQYICPVLHTPLANFLYLFPPI
jgi:hypothetical protein